MTTSASTPATTPASASDRASLRTMRQRKRRVWRNLLTVVVVTALMVVLVMARRDQQDVGRCLETMRFVVHTLESVETRRDGLPTNLPQPKSDGAMDRSHYHYNPRNALAIFSGGPPIGVVCCDHPHRLFTRADGRYVVLAENGALRIEWLVESEFQRRAAGLQLPAQTMVIGGP